MLAEFFHLTEDTVKIGPIARLLRKYVDPGIQFMASDVETGPTAARQRTLDRYRQLLHATVTPSQNLLITFTAFDWYERRVYGAIFLPAGSYGYGVDIGGMSMLSAYYRMSNPSYAYPGRKGLEFFFPALAVRDRMVLVPVGQGNLLERTGLPKADVIRRDVLEVDFGDEVALEAAIQVMAREVRREVRRELVAYRRMSGQEDDDLEEAATHLGVTPAFIEQSLTEEGREAAVVYERVSCDLDKKTVEQGRWTRMNLVVRNDSDEALRGVAVTIKGPVEVLPGTLEVDLPARTTIEVPVAIRPPDAGDFPVEIALVARVHQDLADFLPRHHVWLESIERSSA